jgi:hypothetical protein
MPDFKIVESFVMQQLEFHWTDCDEIWYLSFKKEF